jgi:hypothetical protein
MEGGDYAIV